MIVRESIEFQRGQSTVDALNIGEKQIWHKIIAELNKKPKYTNLSLSIEQDHNHPPFHLSIEGLDVPYSYDAGKELSVIIRQFVYQNEDDGGFDIISLIATNKYNIEVTDNYYSPEEDLSYVADEIEDSLEKLEDDFDIQLYDIFE